VTPQQLLICYYSLRKFPPWLNFKLWWTLDVKAQKNKSAIDDIPPPTSLFFQRDPIPFKTPSAINHTMLQFTNNDTSGFFSNSKLSACTFQFTHSHTYMYMLQQSHCSKSRFIRSTHLLILICTVKSAIAPTSVSREPPYITHSQVFTI